MGNWSGCDGGFLRSRGSDSFVRQRGFNFATIPLQFSLQNPTIEPRFSPRSATIAQRSGHDRAPIVAWMLRRLPSEPVGNSPLRFHTEGGTIAARSLRDRGSIAPRSWSSSTSSLCRSMRIMWAVRCRSGKPSDFYRFWSTCSGCPMEIHRLMEIHRPMERSPFDEDRELLVMPRV